MLYKKIVAICCMICLVVNENFAQSPVADSLLRRVSAMKDDSNKVETLLNLNKEFRSIHPDSALIFSKQALDLAEKVGYAKGRAYAYKGSGLVYLQQGKYFETLEQYEYALQIFDSIGYKEGVANILSNQGALYFSKGDETKALELYLKGLAVAEQTTDSIRIATLLMNIGAAYSEKKGTYDKALDYYNKALSLSRSIGYQDAIGLTITNIGEVYMRKNELDLALKYFNESLIENKGTENYLYTLHDLGELYTKKKDYPTAIAYHQQALAEAGKIESTLDKAQALIGLGDTYLEKGEPQVAEKYYRDAQAIAAEISSANNELKNVYGGLSKSLASQGKYKDAYDYQNLYSLIKDTLYDLDREKKIGGLQFQFDIQKKESQVDLLKSDMLVQDLQLQRQKATKNLLLAGLGIAFIFATVLYRNYRNKIKVNKLLDKQNAEIESLILNILPEEVANELQKTGNATPRFYEKASVLFTDFKSFSKLADDMTPQEVVTELNECFMAFDDIIARHNLEKIKTIGDSYMCAGGIPTPDEAHVDEIILAAMDIRDYMNARNEKRSAKGLPPWDIRIGINTGPLVAGVVGKKKYAYDIWGGTVNIASRMESNGEPGKVNISEATYALAKERYNCFHRGKIFAKNIGEIDMYFIEKK